VAIGFFSLVADENDHARCGQATEAVRSLLGVRVDESWPLASGAEEGVRFESGEESRVRDWSEWLEPEGAQVVASYTSGVLEGLPAVTRNKLGRGAVYYCSARLDRAGFAAIARLLLEEAGAAPLFETPPGVEVTRRSADNRHYIFLLNHSTEAVEVDLGGSRAVDLLGGGPVAGRIRLEALGVAVLREA
jgi:beta-galactosidase